MRGTSHFDFSQVSLVIIQFDFSQVSLVTIQFDFSLVSLVTIQFDFGVKSVYNTAEIFFWANWLLWNTGECNASFC